ncbi:PLD nuclease N-terminal domain-containing protein [Belliella marina]|uniref:PLD nuclease N-terminal domain-containing protein n=1 Tax=Belliella marina TaxID=1644146 RepID=A0ABW4VI95_9BACT
MNLLFIGELGGRSLLILGFLSFVFFIFWVVTIIDIVKSTFQDPNMKLIWVLVVIFTNPLGTIIYWIVAPSQKGNNNFNNYR